MNARAWVAGAAGTTGVAGIAVVGTAALLRRQAAAADRAVRPLVTDAPPPPGECGPPGPALVLAVLGDSSGAGVGAEDTEATLAGRLAGALADRGRRVRVVMAARTGARTRDLPGQVAAVLAEGPQLAVISIGANDVRARASPRRCGRELAAVVTTLRAAGAVVVVATSPDLGTVAAIDQPLRACAGLLSRALERAQVRAAVRAGAAAVPIGSRLGPAFRAHAELFSADGFHPSGRGYAAVAELLLPAILDSGLAEAVPRPSQV